MNPIKAILFDFDGVLIHLPHFYTKELELQGFKNVEESLNAYYGGPDLIACLEGKANSRERIVPYLKNFGWEYSAEEYFRQQYAFEHNYLDLAMLGMVNKLRDKGVKCCLATDQDQQRAKYILESMNLGSIFDTNFTSCFIGARKCCLPIFGSMF